MIFFGNKILKILKEYSEAISQRRADNTMDKRTSNDLQNTKDRATRTPLKNGGELMCSGKVRSSCSICGTCKIGLYDISQCLQVDIVQLF